MHENTDYYEDGYDYLDDDQAMYDKVQDFVDELNESRRTE